MGLKVFYDGACPLCTREIDFYRNSRGGEEIDWVNIADQESDEIAPGISRCAALKRLHVEDDAGHHNGALAFAKIWEALPRFRLLGQLVQLPGVTFIAEALYRLFLIVRPAMQQLARKAGAQ